MTESNTDTSPEPPQPKSARLKVILKAVLKGVSLIWSLYRAWSKLIDLYKEILG